MLSVVIPTLDRASMLGRVIDRLSRQSVGVDGFEVIVGADAMEGNMDAVRAAAVSRELEVNVVQATTPGAAAARNRALSEVRHPVVLFLGDDMLPSRDLVARHVDHHRRHPESESGLLGHVRWARELRTTPFMQWLDQGMQFGFHTINGTAAEWWHFVTANASVKTEILERAGGFDEEYRFAGYEDTDLAYRLNQLGFRLTYDPRAEVEHLHPPTIEGWRRRMQVVAIGERRFVTKYPEMQPYFQPIFQQAVSQPHLQGRAARLARVVPRRTPKIGPVVWRRAGLWFAQQLAPAFLEAWHRDEAERQVEPRGVNPSGSPPGGPK